jgi:hypothetical protein
MTRHNNPSKRCMNQETKAVVSWIRQNRRKYRRMVKRAFNILQKVEASSTARVAASDTDRDANDLATALSLIFDVDSPLADSNCVFADLLVCALHRVDWHKLAVKLLAHSSREQATDETG